MRCVLSCGEMGEGTIEAYIRRFREQPPAPPEARAVPNNAEFWWQNHSKYEPDSSGDHHNGKSSDGFFSPFSSRSSDSGRRGQRYSRPYDHDHESDDDLGETHEMSQNTHQSSYDDFDDFEKRTENLMKKCDNLLLENHSISNQETNNSESNSFPESKNNVVGMDNEEFPPWVSVDIPSTLNVPNKDPVVLSPVESSSPPLIEERNSPDSIESFHPESQEADHCEEFAQSTSESDNDDPSDVPDTESEVSDLELEETSVETTDELIKRAEQLLLGYSAPEQPSQPLSIELVDSMTSSDPLLLPSPSIDIPIPETPPTRPIDPSGIALLTTEPETSPASPTQSPLSEKKIPLCNEIGIQTDFLPINPSPPVNMSLMSSMTTTLFISPSSTPRHSPFSESDALPVQAGVDDLPQIVSGERIPDGPLQNTQDDPPVLPPQVEETPSPLPQPGLKVFNSSLTDLSLNPSETIVNLRYEDIEPYLSDEITATLWNRLVIVREQRKRIQKRQKINF